jgi:hypothetical protein
MKSHEKVRVTVIVEWNIAKLRTGFCHVVGISGNLNVSFIFE